MKRAFITGASGQLAHYLISALRAADVAVMGMVISDAEAPRLHALGVDVAIGNILDFGSIASAFKHAEPDVIFHLASPTFVPDTWAQPRAALDAIAGGTLNVLDSARLVCPDAKVLCASTAEIFANSKESPQTQRTLPAPNTPYGIAKSTAFEFTKLYRERHGQRACSLVLYPFESPLRAPNFVIPKICRAAARIGRNKGERLKLGDISAKRDWSWAPDVADAFVAAAKAPVANDLLIGSGKLHRVSDALGLAFQHVGMDWHDHVDIDAALVRPADPVLMTPAVAETKAAIGWEATTSFEKMIALLVDSALSDLS